MAYPSTITSFSTPQPTDRLNSPSHSSIEGAQNTGITELMTFVGTTASVQGSLIYDIRATASDGGGHVQTAVKGGTGQTTFTKGDILTAQSASVLGKLAVGNDGDIIKANSSMAAGMHWQPNQTNKIKVSTLGAFTGALTTETSILSATIPGSTLGTNNAVRARLFVKNMGQGTASNRLWTMRANYGTTTFATFNISSVQATSVNGMIEMNVLGNGFTSSQVGIVTANLFDASLPLRPLSSFVGMITLATGTIGQDSGANNTLGLTLLANTGADNTIEVSGYTIEKIIT